jgi:signal transduction histidine kinase/ligand-binding sensor domain-containing protein/DNA-binding response OmpR family regulator
MITDKKHYNLLVYFLPAFILSLLCHQAAGESSILQARQYTTLEGLSNNEITGIIQDHTGYIWIGTQNGLNRFNGYYFDIFRMNAPGKNNLPGNKITALDLDDTGRLWAGTEGLSLYNPESGSFSHLFHLPGPDHSPVNSIVNDDNGKIWIASYNGVMIFDPGTGDVQKLEYREEIKIAPASVELLFRESAPGRVISMAAALLGISFPSGEILLNELLGEDDNSEDILYYKKIVAESTRKHDPGSLLSNHVVTLAKDPEGYLWIVYGHEGLSRVDPSSMEKRHFTGIIKKSGAIDQINDIITEGNRIWIATSNEGLKLLDTSDGSVARIKLDGENYIQHLRLEGNELWISDNQGIVIYNTYSGEFRRVGILIPGQGIITRFIGKFTFRDNQDNIWIGTHYMGVLMSTPHRSFRTLRTNTEPPAGNPHNAVSSVAVDETDNIWVGYVKGGVEYFGAGIMSGSILRRPGFPDTPATDVFKIQFCNNEIWIGSYSGGAEVYDKRGNLKRTFIYDSGREGGLPGNDIRDIATDGMGNIFLAVHGSGIARVDNGTGIITTISHDQADPAGSILSNWTQAVLAENNGNLWIGSVEGLSRYSPEGNSVRNWRFEGLSRSHMNIRCIYRDQDGILWLGTDYGIIAFEPSSSSWYRITMDDGLSNSMIAAVIGDKNGDLWISTKRGLNLFKRSLIGDDPVGYLQNAKASEINELINTLDFSDGMPGDVFSHGAAAGSRDGHLFFGNSAGVVWFHPDSIRINPHIPPVIISELSLFNKALQIGDHTGILSRVPNYQGRIELKYNQRMVTLEFHALNYIYPERNMYAYKMEGFDQEWIYAGSRRDATYTNLNPGLYNFRVKASNNNGIWNEEGSSLEILIRPPIWHTNAAYVFYALLIAMLMFMLRQVMLFRTRAKLEVSKAREIDEIKSTFFTNVSHEFRTPLTLIEGPVEKLLKEKEQFDWQRDFYQVNLIHRNVQRLKLLITELMEFRKLTEGRRQLKILSCDLSLLLKDIANAFDYLADEKNIDFRLKVSYPVLITWVDPKIIEKVMFNLLSNAFKFTPPGGSIQVVMRINQQSDELISNFYAREYIRIEVSDTGPGIPDELKQKVFERFFQSESSSVKTEGSGIGLALVKELITLHKGQVEIKPSKSPQFHSGTTFVFKLPFGKEYYPGCITDETYQGPDKTELLKKTMALANFRTAAEPAESRHHNQQHTILIVEDDAETRQWIENELQSTYNVLCSHTGEEGFEIAGTEFPDLILSDIMLPRMDGYAFCSAIKSDIKTEHIPVILVSACSEDKDMLRGLETGADDFITKPFVLDELKLRIKNCIAARIKLRQKFINDFHSSGDTGNLNADDRFLSKALRIVNDNISRPDLDVDFFVSEMAMSRAQLYRKFHALTNQTVKEFVRIVRLKKAATLLDSGKYNVSEAAWAVGFGDLPYFTRTFKARFGINPSKYANGKKDIPSTRIS